MTGFRKFIRSHAWFRRPFMVVMAVLLVVLIAFCFAYDTIVQAFKGAWSYVADNSRDYWEVARETLGDFRSAW